MRRSAWKKTVIDIVFNIMAVTYWKTGNFLFIKIFYRVAKNYGIYRH